MWRHCKYHSIKKDKSQFFKWTKGENGAPLIVVGDKVGNCGKMN